MNLKKSLRVLLFLLLISPVSKAQSIKISNEPKSKTISFSNSTLSLTLDYNHKANISQMIVNGQSVIKGDSGIYSAIRTKDAAYSSLHTAAPPTVHISGNTISLNNILYGDKDLTINETWTFIVTNSDIKFNITRTLLKTVTAEKIGLPVFMFNNINDWNGAYQDYGGLAWFYLFDKKQDTYGVHSSSSRFWNSKTGNGLTIAVDAANQHVVMDYCRTTNDKLAYQVSIAQKEILPRFDSGTQRRRYTRDTTNIIWEPITLNAGKSTESITLSYFDFNKQFDRGNLVGINKEQVSAVLNTIARIGVIDKQHFGGNSWHTPYGPICLHEQYIGQMGLAINDKTYLKGYQDCLDFYRDNAIKPDGRVWPRWAYTNEDAMEGAYTDNGFYEAQWGYLLDSNPDLVTNVAGLYDQTGDLKWVKTHQRSCEKALDWIMKRDSNGNGLVEMMTDNHQQKKGSDWIDIIWAAYENAFVNAKLYHALTLWSGIEAQLGNDGKGKYYAQFAEKLKASFNKPTTEGGFWDAEHQCYIHWRDKDGSIHGTNMVTPVNFMAIAYGICDDIERKKAILDGIETQMQKEKLFFWPLCMFSYAPGEGNDWQFPFPNYENGDIFLSWGSVGVRAYAAYKPELALKYVNNVLAQYAKDGLAFQRYGRAKQDGRGDDILSGNSLAVVGLYQAIYGINPLYNRFYLDPHITEALAGTSIKYNYRDQQLTIGLAMNKFSVSDDRCTITATNDFGFFDTGKDLLYFNGRTDRASLKISTAEKLQLYIKQWNREKMIFTPSFTNRLPNRIGYQLNDLEPGKYYTILVNGTSMKVKSNKDGTLNFDRDSKYSGEIVISL